MPGSIFITVSHDSLRPGLIEGFRYFWARYVNGFDPSCHCQKCLLGTTEPDFLTGTARSGVRVELPKVGGHDFVYVCGVGLGQRSELGARNFHFPLRYCEGAVAEAQTYNGYTVRAENAERLPIPDPMPAGWEGRDQETLRCKNFRFGLHHYGLSNRLLTPPTP